MHERSRQADAGRPSAGAPIDGIDRVLGKLERELAAQQLDRLGSGEGKLRRGDVEDVARKSPAREARELRRSTRREDEVHVVGQLLDQLVGERCERGDGAQRRMVVEEDDDVIELRQLLGERARELGEATIETPTLIERVGQVLAKLRMIATERADKIAEEHERIVIAPLQGEPRHTASRRA